MSLCSCVLTSVRPAQHTLNLQPVTKRPQEEDGGQAESEA